MFRFSFLVPLLALACSTKSDDDGDTDVVDSDTVADTVVVPQDTEIADTVVVDTEVQDTVVVDTEVEDTVVVDTEVPDTVVVDTEVPDTVVDTDPGPTLLPSYTMPPTAASTGGTGWQPIGMYSRAVMVVKTDGMPTTPFTITELRFRRDDAATDFATALSVPDVEIWLGTAGTDWAQTTFADTYSGDQVLAWSGTMQIDAATGYTGAFDGWVVPLSTPFTFDPTQGKKLLVEMRNPTPGSWGTPSSYLRFDCQNDGANHMTMSDVAGLPTAGNNSTGCGWAFEMVVEAPAAP